jgi:hypothetical protein
MNLHIVKILVLISVCAVLVSFIFISNEARKEIYYLCGNFNKGVSYLNVTRQLDTVSLSRYKIQALGIDKQIVHSSNLNFHFFKCTINFDTNGKVISALYT